MSRPLFPAELIAPRERKAKNLAVGERGFIPSYALAVVPSRKIFVDQGAVLEEPEKQGPFDMYNQLPRKMWQFEVERVGWWSYKLYLPPETFRQLEVRSGSYLWIPFRWFLGYRPVVEVQYQPAESVPAEKVHQ